MVEKRDFNTSLYYADGIEIEETGAGIEITAGSIKKGDKTYPMEDFCCIVRLQIERNSLHGICLVSFFYRAGSYFNSRAGFFYFDAVRIIKTRINYMSFMI